MKRPTTEWNGTLSVICYICINFPIKWSASSWAAFQVPPSPCSSMEDALSLSSLLEVSDKGTLSPLTCSSCGWSYWAFWLMICVSISSGTPLRHPNLVLPSPTYSSLMILSFLQRLIERIARAWGMFWILSVISPGRNSTWASPKCYFQLMLTQVPEKH